MSPQTANAKNGNQPNNRPKTGTEKNTDPKPDKEKISLTSRVDALEARISVIERKFR
jgi:hypothetical protein